MPTIRLGDADRERYGAPEWLEFTDALSIRDAKAFQAAGGKYMDFFKRDEPAGWQAIAWLALHRAGVAVKVDELEDLDLAAVRLADSQPSGKASSGGSGRTRRTSAESSTSRRGTSKTSN